MINSAALTLKRKSLNPGFLKRSGFFVLKYYLSLRKIQHSPDYLYTNLLLDLRKSSLTPIFWQTKGVKAERRQ